MGKFIVVTRKVRGFDNETILNTDNITMVASTGGACYTDIYLNVAYDGSFKIRVDERYEDIRYKLFTDEVH